MPSFGTVKSLFEKLEEKDGIPSALKRFNLHGKELESTKNLQHYNIVDNCTIFCFLRVDGGNENGIEEVYYLRKLFFDLFDLNSNGKMLFKSMLLKLNTPFTNRFPKSELEYLFKTYLLPFIDFKNNFKKKYFVIERVFFF